MKSLKELEELQWTPTDVAPLIPEVIARDIETVARARSIWEGSVRVNRDLVGKPGESLKVVKRGAITASDVSAGTEIPTAEPTLSEVVITPTKIGVGVPITQEAIDASARDLIQQWLDEAGEAIAKKTNEDFVATLNAEDARKFPAETPGTLKFVDIMKAVADIRGANWNPDRLLMNPQEQGDILTGPDRDMFLDVSRYGERVPILMGEVGQMAGCKVLVSTYVPAGTVFVFDSSRCALNVIKRDITVKRKEEPKTDSIEVYVTKIQKFAVLNSDALYIITGA